MKATGYVRKLNRDGKIVLPAELRRGLNINYEDIVEVVIKDDYIVIKKYRPVCIFCRGTKDIRLFQKKTICGECVKAIFENAK
ncbi:AbrB/MazE/SpoVT family DNA-binding domain-containing protein [Pelotomaculum propionicicum]|uniref:AbrB/MazE/SpoVT family DNA-binding domain-containing protein n=1 Tax=Pelotomaculum propionicicum TaxID=258475 RepID=UPI003B810AC1